MSAARFFKVAILSLALAACSDATAPAGTSIAGKWNLSTIAGKPLPFAMDSTPTARLEVYQDNILLNEDGTLGGGTTWRIIRSNGTVETIVTPATGRWTKTETGVVITYEDMGGASSTTATVHNQSMTLDGNGMLFVYRR